jgi:hypothetical protein
MIGCGSLVCANSQLEGEARAVCVRVGRLGAHASRSMAQARSSNKHRPAMQGGVVDSIESRPSYALKLLPQPQVEVEFGLLNTKPEPMISSL